MEGGSAPTPPAPKAIEQIVPGYVPPREGPDIDVAAEARAARQLLDHLVRRQAVVERMLLPMAAGYVILRARALLTPIFMPHSPLSPFPLLHLPLL